MDYIFHNHNATVRIREKKNNLFQLPWLAPICINPRRYFSLKKIHITVQNGVSLLAVIRKAIKHLLGPLIANT